jgi:hypothetical protein
MSWTSLIRLLSYNRRFVRAAQVCDEVLLHSQIYINVTQYYNLIISCWQLRFFIQDPALHLEFLANCITELSLLEYSLLSYPPSLIAASAIFLAKFVLQPSIELNGQEDRHILKLEVEGCYTGLSSSVQLHLNHGKYYGKPRP